MLFTPIVAILHNEKTGRYHSIWYSENPLPGGTGPRRWKSKMHHTEGHETLEESKADVERVLMQDGVKEYGLAATRYCYDVLIPWDGEGIPTEVRFFELVDEKTARILL